MVRILLFYYYFKIQNFYISFILLFYHFIILKIKYLIYK